MDPHQTLSIVRSHHTYLRQLAADEPLIPGSDRVTRLLRRSFGSALIHFGYRLAGLPAGMGKPGFGIPAA